MLCRGPFTVAYGGDLTDENDKSGYGELIDRFGRGWENGSPESIVEVFAADGVFIPDPFEPSLKGHDAIREYWKSVPLEQAEVSFRRGEIYVAGPWFATEFKCTFRRRRTGAWIVVRGSLFCETEDGVMKEMRMYWHRQSPNLVA